MKEKGTYAYSCLVTENEQEATSSQRCLLDDGTVLIPASRDPWTPTPSLATQVEFSEPRLFEGSILLYKDGDVDYLEETDVALPFSISRKDGLVASGAARRYMAFIAFFTVFALVFSWSLAYYVSPPGPIAPLTHV